MLTDIISRKKIILLAVGLLVIAVSLTILYLYIVRERTTTSLSVSFDGVDSAQLIDNSTQSSTAINPSKPIQIDTTNTNYTIKYEGSDGYTDGSVVVEPFQTAVDLKADYSRERLNSMYRDEKSKILDKITGYAPDLDKHYRIKNDALYVRGDWFGAKLEYTGNALTDRDNVGIVLRKTNDTWEVVTKPPVPLVPLKGDSDIEIPLSLRSILNAQLSRKSPEEINR